MVVPAGARSIDRMLACFVSARLSEIVVLITGADGVSGLGVDLVGEFINGDDLRADVRPTTFAFDLSFAM